MNPLQRTIIEKTGNDNGFEHVVASDLSGVTLASAHHARVGVGVYFGPGIYYPSPYYYPPPVYYPQPPVVIQQQSLPHRRTLALGRRTARSLRRGLGLGRHLAAVGLHDPERGLHWRRAERVGTRSRMAVGSRPAASPPRTRSTSRLET